jgi:capsular exopolysaccharide synthesis family protein
MADVLINDQSGHSPRLNLEAKAPVPFPVPVQPSPPPPSNATRPPDPPAEDTEVHLSDYLRVLYKRRWPALTVFLIVFLGTCIFTFTATPIYNARVQLLIEKENTNVVTFKEAVEQNQLTDDYYQTQYRILQSRALARRTLDSLNLWHFPQFESPETGKARSLRATIAGWFSRDSSTREVEPPGPEETKAQSRTIDVFLRDLTVTPVRNSRLVDVTYDSPVPELAARVANGLARAYIEQNMEFKYLSSKEASDWLSARLGEQRKQVESSEQALQKYREGSKDALSLEDRQNIVVQRLADLNQAVTRAKLDRIEKESTYNQIREVQNNTAALDSFPPILANGFIQQQKSELAELQRQQAQLGEKLGPNHPDMVKVNTAIRTAEAKIQAEVAKVVQAMENDYQRSLLNERSLTQALEQQKRDALDLNRKGSEYGALSRDANSNRQIFDSLMQRTKETAISGELRTSNIRIVDAAETPRRPSSPNTRNNLLLGLVTGMILSVGLAFFFEYLDNRIKNPEELKRHLGLPFLGMIPALFDLEASSPLINSAVPPNFSECFRTLRTNVLFSTADEGLRSLVVTSTGPGEGKTLVSTNLAVGLAQAGMRVLLIDADMRKPRVHMVFDKPRQPGLSNVLVASAKFSETVHATPIPGLWMVPAGAYPPNPSELLSSKRFSDLVASLGAHFDWVIIDTPPIMAVADSSIVAHLTTGVVFVVGAEMTSRYAAARAVEQLTRSRAKFLGAVLNRVDLQHNAYYYAEYYRREYSDYYQRPKDSARSR